MSGSVSKRRLRKVTERSLERRRRGQAWHSTFNSRIENSLSKNQQIPVQGSLARLSVEGPAKAGALCQGGSFALKIMAMVCYIVYDVSNSPLVPQSEDVL